MSHTIYCDRCGRESRNDIEPHEEQNILPGPVKGRDFHNLYSPREIEFIRLGEHRETYDKVSATKNGLRCSGRAPKGAKDGWVPLSR